MRMIGRRGTILAGFLLAVLGLAAGIWWLTFAAALDQLEDRGEADLSLAADRLIGQVQRMRDLAVFLADHPELAALLPGGGNARPAHALLLSQADRTGAERLQLVDAAGQVLASSDGRAGGVVTTPAFYRAMDGALGISHGVVGDQRLYTIAAPVFAPDGPVLGAVIVEVDMLRLEWNWASGASPVYFSTDGGVVFTANRSDLVLTRLGAGRGPAFPLRWRRDLTGHDIWALRGGPYLPNYALHRDRDLPVIEMRAGILLNLAPPLRLASLQSAVAAALCLAFGALLFFLAERRRALAERLNVEERANAALEARVAERTGELQALNADLRREIGERQEAEAALRRAQADLVQAGKLSALGQMSAGISHELNQPLMAIQSFAENGSKYMALGKPERAAENLGRIGELAHRMGRIIRNLRAFARQERAEVSDVDLAAVVDAALEIARPKIDNADVAVQWDRPAGPVLVRGGEVRLQQVVMNLVANAVDAMAASDERRIEIALAPGDPVVLSVRDTGPGIAEPERIFDPFYTTKQVGEAEGMGLGLSISYGLVQSFGGAIRGRNHPGGGAVFSIELTPSELERAA